MRSYWYHSIQNTLQKVVRKRLWQDSKGLTLVELLVALVLSSLLLTFVFSLHLFSNKLVFNWQKKTALEDAALLCMETLTRDISNVNEVLDAGKNKLSFTTRNDKEITYAWNDSKIQRNSDALNQKQIVADSLEFTYFGRVTSSDTSGTGILDIGSDFSFLTKQDKQERISGVKVKITFGGYGKSITLSNFVRLKKAVSVH